MRRYETIFIINSDISDEDRSLMYDRIKDLIEKHKGLLVLLDVWGDRRLAYEIEKKTRGYYVRLDYCGMGDLVNEIERLFRIDDRVMKYMTVMLDDKVDIDNVKEEMARAQAEEESAAEDKSTEKVAETSDEKETAKEDVKAADSDKDI